MTWMGHSTERGGGTGFLTYVISEAGAQIRVPLLPISEEDETPDFRPAQAANLSLVFSIAERIGL
jgi:hypothetical protein